MGRPGFKVKGGQSVAGTHRSTFVQQEEEVQEIHQQKDDVPSHHIQVTSVQSRPDDEESTSCRTAQGSL